MPAKILILMQATGTGKNIDIAENRYSNRSLAQNEIRSISLLLSDIRAAVHIGECFIFTEFTKLYKSQTLQTITAFTAKF